MNHTFTILVHEFRVTVRRPSYRILTALFPLLGLLGILAYIAIQGRGIGEAKPVTFGYVDMAGLVQGFQEQGVTTFQPFPDVAQGREALLKGDVKALYVMPPDYPSTGVVLEYTTESGLNISENANRPLERFLVANILGSGSPEWVHSRVRTPALVSRVQLDTSGEPVPGIQAAKAVFFFILGLLLVMSIFMSSGFLLNSIGEEKENRVMEILLSSVTPGQLMVGKILALGAAGLLQMVVWVVAGRGLLALGANRISLLSNVSLPGVEALVGILYFVLGYLLFATLFAGLGAITTTQREGQQITGLFVVPAIIPYYAFPYILGHPDSFIARFLTLFPLTAPITVMERLGVGAIAPWEIAASALILLATCTGALWLVVRLFRAYLLMYGKRPGLREMWGALSQR
mgnify:CR=1 FL=1